MSCCWSWFFCRMSFQVADNGSSKLFHLHSLCFLFIFAVLVSVIPKIMYLIFLFAKLLLVYRYPQWPPSELRLFPDTDTFYGCLETYILSRMEFEVLLSSYIEGVLYKCFNKWMNPSFSCSHWTLVFFIFLMFVIVIVSAVLQTS